MGFFFFGLFLAYFPPLALAPWGGKACIPSFLSLGSHAVCEPVPLGGLAISLLVLPAACLRNCGKSPGKASCPVLGF